jgi:hypothetical protein
MNSALTRLLLVPVAGLLLMGAAYPQLRVQVQGGKLALQADGAPLYGVLWAISAQTGVTLDLQGGPGSTDLLVTEDFKNVPLERGLTQLLKKYLKPSSYMVVVDRRTGAIETIHVRPGAFGSAPAPASNSKDVGEASATTGGTSAGDAGLSEAERELRDTRRAAYLAGATQALEAARSATTVEEQIKTVRYLGAFEDPRVVAFLHSALASDVPEVRTAALEAMRWSYVLDPRVHVDVRSLIVNDPAPAVRQAAYEVLIRYDKTAEWRAVLERLAAEPGGALAARARIDLVRLEQEARERAQAPPDDPKPSDD